MMKFLSALSAAALIPVLMTGGAGAQAEKSAAAAAALQKAMASEVGGAQHIGIPTKNMAATEAFWQKLGFKLAGGFQNGASKVRFFKRGSVMIESWESDEATGKAGAINHIALDTKNAAALYPLVKAAGFVMIDKEVKSLPFWRKGIKYFNIKGPNGEIVEFCERVK